MSNTRLQKLLEFIKEEPEDVFLKYALAMEYLGLKDFENAKNYFEDVIKVDKNHVAAYYQLGKIFESLNDETSAISIYEKGMEAAKLKNDTRSIREIRTALDIIGSNIRNIQKGDHDKHQNSQYYFGQRISYNKLAPVFRRIIRISFFDKFEHIIFVNYKFYYLYLFPKLI